MKQALTTAAVNVASSPTREELTFYMPLVHQVVARSLRKLPPNVLRDDLIAAGTMGLLDALRRSADRDSGFEWYARVRIRGAVVDELRTQDWLTRRARTRMTKAQAQGESAGTAVIGFDDLPEARALSLADESIAGPHEAVELRMQRSALECAVAKLPEREAQIVSWHYFEGVAFKDIASRLGVSEPRISQLHARAMGRLRETLADGTVDHAAA
jgi:RNA polymerase sigma factor for flagellar operon FliA